MYADSGCLWFNASTPFLVEVHRLEKDADLVIGLPHIGTNDLANPHLDVAKFVRDHVSFVSYLYLDQKRKKEEKKKKKG